MNYTKCRAEWKWHPLCQHQLVMEIMIFSAFYRFIFGLADSSKEIRIRAKQRDGFFSSGNPCREPAKYSKFRAHRCHINEPHCCWPTQLFIDLFHDVAPMWHFCVNIGGTASLLDIVPLLLVVFATFSDFYRAIVLAILAHRKVPLAGAAENAHHVKNVCMRVERVSVTIGFAFVNRKTFELSLSLA